MKALVLLLALAACGHVQTPNQPASDGATVPAITSKPPTKCAPCGVPGRKPGFGGITL